MTDIELGNDWLVNRPERYNEENQKILLDELGRYNVEHFDHRSLTNKPDSYILKITCS